MLRKWQATADVNVTYHLQGFASFDSFEAQVAGEYYIQSLWTTLILPKWHIQGLLLYFVVISGSTNGQLTVILPHDCLSVKSIGGLASDDIYYLSSFPCSSLDLSQSSSSLVTPKFMHDFADSASWDKAFVYFETGFGEFYSIADVLWCNGTFK